APRHTTHRRDRRPPPRRRRRARRPCSPSLRRWLARRGRWRLGARGGGRWLARRGRRLRGGSGGVAGGWRLVALALPVVLGFGGNRRLAGAVDALAGPVHGEHRVDDGAPVGVGAGALGADPRAHTLGRGGLSRLLDLHVLGGVERDGDAGVGVGGPD